MKNYLLLVVLLLSGCATASIDRTTGPKTAYAPSNEVEGGVVSYLNQGAKFVKDARRADAYKKMFSYCKGSYKIVTEGEALGMGSAMPIGGILFYGQEHYQKINFECVKSSITVTANP